MTESDWDSCSDPQEMLEFLQTSGKLSERKARLFSVACCRRIWPLLIDERSRRAVEVAEREADGAGPEEVLRLAERDAEAAIPSLSADFRPSEQPAAAGAMAVVNVEATAAARLACGWARNVRLALAYEEGPGDLSGTGKRVFADWGVEAAALLRDLFGPLPFRDVTIDPSLLPWERGTVLQVARTIYKERRFDGLPNLGGLLREAGCDNEDVLRHCLEQEKVHQRGCWVIDLLLNKE
jgi:hypothetical protein